MQSSRLVLVAASLSLSLGAQTVTGSAVANNDCTLRAEQPGFAPPAVRTIVGGSDMTPGFKLDAISGVAAASFAFQVDQTPATTFRADVQAIAPTFGFDGGAELSSDADFQLALHANGSASGLLTVSVSSWPSQGAPGVGNFWVDIDNDGRWDVVGDISGRTIRREFLRLFGPEDLVVRVLHAGSVSVPTNFIGDYRASLMVSWPPIGGTVNIYGSSCGIELGYVRTADGDYQLSTLPAPTVATYYLFGFNETKVELGLPPFCVLRTGIDHVVAAAGAAYLDVPLLPLPPGFVMNVQAVNFPALDTNKQPTVLLSNALRLSVAP